MLKYLIVILSILGSTSMSFAEEDQSSAMAFLIEQSKTISQKSVISKKAYPVRNGSIHQMVTESANRHGVPSHIAHAVVKVESNYNCSARSSAGAVGIMQTLPATARSMGISGNLTSCSNGLEAGMRYLSHIVRKHGTSCGALSLYERGIAARPSCTSYGSKVIRLASR